MLVHSKLSPKRRKIIETWKFQGPWDETGSRLEVGKEFWKESATVTINSVRGYQHLH